MDESALVVRSVVALRRSSKMTALAQPRSPRTEFGGRSQNSKVGERLPVKKNAKEADNTNGETGVLANKSRNPFLEHLM